MDKRYLWLLLIAAIVFLLMVAGINMFVRSAQNIQPSNVTAKETVLPVVKAKKTVENKPSQNRQQGEPVYEPQLPKGKVLLN